MVFLSIVVPCFNEEESVELFFSEIQKTLSNLDFEIIFVDDGSRDNTLAEIKSIAAGNPNVSYLSFSRNFGKEAAIYAGLNNASGDMVCIMDADLQHPPALLPEMICALDDNDVDVAAARRVSRKSDTFFKTLGSRLFYPFFNRISNVELVDGATDYRVMRRPVVDSILRLEEYNRFSKGLFQWVGFNTRWIDFENIERAQGETTWSFGDLVRYSIEAIVAFTTLPLTLSIFLGGLFSVFSFVYIILIVVKYLLFSDPVQGFTTIMVSMLFLGGVILLSIGILGKYIEKMYLEIKNRPIYIVKESDMDDFK
ncbi:glycosyltransferase family 2 protein [Methanobrevibacter sp.]|uniref:glycosyltransferase family 2 protein n=1 Tax=Methanobrevibacter sp. TaxID=66852 RepID=UPI003890C524